MKVIMVYSPVIHKGYVELLQRHPDAALVYVWGHSLIRKEPALRKEIRSLDPESARNALRAILGRQNIQIAEIEDLKTIASIADPLVMPDDEVSRRLLSDVLLSMGLKSHKLETIFLRWDSMSALSENQIAPDEVRKMVEVKFFSDLAKREGANSSDWWRRVGAVLYDSLGNVIHTAHNHHLPTSYTPYIDGDPRGSFRKGVNIELTTAIHAEAAVIAWAAMHGVRTAGLGMLVTTFPCPVCAKLIAEAGIKELMYLEGYAMLDGVRVLKACEVKIVKVE